MMTLLLVLIDTRFTHDIPPSKVAAMCLAAIRFQRNIEPIWSSKLEKLTKYTWDQIKGEFPKLLQIQKRPYERLSTELIEAINQESHEEYFD